MAMENLGTTKFVRLGDYIEQCDERNIDTKFSLDDVRGISIMKKLIFTKADMKDVDLSPYKLLKPKEFCYVTVTSRNGGKISLAMNDTNNTFIVSSSYINFRSKDCSILLPEYLFTLLNRSEFDRYSRFNSWGSARETFDWEEMCRIEIPLPSIEVQKEIVAAYNGLKSLAEQNEALIAPITKACDAFIIDCKNRFPVVKIGDYICVADERNSNNIYAVNELRGVTNEGVFDTSKANTIGLKFSNYKIVRSGYFAYNPARINIGSIAYNSGDVCIISPMYCAFFIKPECTSILNPKFLNLWFRRKEFQRSTLFYATGSVRDIFDFNLMCEVRIPLPPIDVQESIVNTYECLEQAKKIATEAREKLKDLCPALVQRAANS